MQGQSSGTLGSDLMEGVRAFQRDVRPRYQELFDRLARGQRPRALFLTCSDSRLVPELFVSAEPGELFTVRNIGNLVPPWSDRSGSSESSAIDFALTHLKVTEIIVCGHSECGAMQALCGSPADVSVDIQKWLRHGAGSLRRASATPSHLPKHNRLSQANVVQQLEHLRSYPGVCDLERRGVLTLRGWWFDIACAEVLVHHEGDGFISAEGAAPFMGRTPKPKGGRVISEGFEF